MSAERSITVHVLVLAIALVVPIAGALHAQSAAAPILAVDEGTRLFPIAQLTGSQWVPPPATGLARVPESWTRWYTAGGSAPIRLRSTMPEGGCAAARAFAIATPLPPSRAVTPGQYAGLATTGPLPVERLLRITSATPGWPLVVAAVTPLFERRAREHGVSASTLAAVPMTLDEVHAVGRGADTTYYFEASKRVPDAGNTPDEDPLGIVRIAVSGWLRHEGTRIVPSGTKGELHWDPADARAASPASTLAPLGVLRDGANRIWVMAGAIGARRTLTLYAVGAGTVRMLFSVERGEC